MKFASIDKTVRNSTWPAVRAPEHEYVKEAKKWCEEYQSDGRFYHHYTNTRWWFEREEDAMMFSLRWGAKRQ